MKFPARIRKQAESLIITLPNELVKVMGLNDGDICQFDIEKADYKRADEVKE